MDAIRNKANADPVVDAQSDTETIAPLRRAAHASAPASAAGVLTPGTTLSDGRLSIRRRLGQGGMGIVYEAFDARRGHAVALKVLTHAGAESVYRLKSEFRALSETRHPNLVTLYELWCDGALWCFTMELVEGLPFDRWVRSLASADAGDGSLDEARLRQALPQLLDAVAAMHDAGKLHRDLKPPNVLVTDDGRVVVLDFGLVVDPEPGGVGQTVSEIGLSGTPAYMAPEQAAGQRALTASDLYAVGTMLFEALTGRLPFEGPAGAALAAKQYDDAPRASSLAPHVPADLDALCLRLLARDPSARPSARALQSELGALPDLAADSSATSRTRRATSAAREAKSPELLGREQELSALRDAFEVARSGRAVVLFVSGESGIGKSALCEAFLRETSARGATVLAGRCNERENVPFKGFDSLVDDLSRHLRRLARVEVESRLPRDVSLLPRLFPVLDRIEAIADAPQKLIPDPQELRRCAFAAFGELLGRMRDRGALCLHLDDAQWLDTDSVLFMRALLLHPEPAPWLWLVSHRSEDADRNPALQRVRDAVESNRRIEPRTLALGPLSEAATRQLAAALLPPSVPAEQATERIARESGGSPLFVDELVRYLTRHVGDVDGRDHISIRTALADHVAALPAAARRLLQLAALAGRPLPAERLIAASAASHAAIDLLRAAHLLRWSSLEGGALVECYHDRVRETVSAQLSEAERIECWVALAVALEPQEGTDPELLARCFEGAGQRAQAARYTARAAEAAMRGMAFLHAAELYAHALELDAWEPEARRALRIAHADALASAGRGKHAAEAYLRAADDCSAVERQELRRRAAEQLQTTGHVDEGTALFRQLFRDQGLTLPTGAAAALRHVVWSQLRLSFRGLKFQRRQRSDVPPAVLFKLETMRAALDGITAHAPLVAASMVNDYVRLALDAGVPWYVAEGLTSLAYFTAFANPGADERIDELMALADSLIDESSDAGLVGRIDMIRGAVALNRGRWAEGRAYEVRAIAALQSAGGGITWVLDGARIFDQLGAFFLGDFRGVAASTRALVEEGLNLDRVWVAAMLSGPLGAPSWLCAGDAAGFERTLVAVRSRWQPQAEALWPDFNAAFGQIALHMYRGEAAQAHAACERAWPALARSLMARAEIGLGVGAYFRGTAAVAALRVAAPADASRALSAARDSARRLGRLRLAAAPALRAVVQAGLALHAHDTAGAAALLRTALIAFDVNGMRMFVAAVGRRLAQLQGGGSGSELLAASDAAMREQGVADLDAMTELLCGGCGTSPPPLD